MVSLREKTKGGRAVEVPEMGVVLRNVTWGGQVTSVSRLKEMREPAPWISGKVHSSRESTKAPRRDMPGVLRESQEARRA